jgi:signal transduction histidine kinase
MLFDIIQEEITRLNGLVTELLRFARPMNVRREDVPIAEVFAAITAKLEARYTFDIHVDDDAEVRSVWADPALLRLALTNVVDNARQAMPEGGALLVVAARSRLGNQRAVRVEVADTGQGMDSRTARRALDPFFSTRPSGTGLGLAIAARIAEAHDGTLELRSRPGEGTTVTLVLPVRRAEKQRDSRISVAPRA